MSRPLSGSIHPAQTACPNYSYCVPFAGKTLSGNLAILPYTYAYSAAVRTTAADAGADSFTCFDGSVDSTTTIPLSTNYHPHNGLCYASNTAANSVRGIITFGTTPVTNVAADASQWYNILNTSDPLGHSRERGGNKLNDCQRSVDNHKLRRRSHLRPCVSDRNSNHDQLHGWPWVHACDNRYPRRVRHRVPDPVNGRFDHSDDEDGDGIDLRRAGLRL